MLSPANLKSMSSKALLDTVSDITAELQARFARIETAHKKMDEIFAASKEMDRVRSYYTPTKEQEVSREIRIVCEQDQALLEPPLGHRGYHDATPQDFKEYK